MNEYLDTEGTAQRLGISSEYVRVLVNRGFLTPQREGRRMRFLAADIDAFNRERSERRAHSGLRKVVAGLQIAVNELRTLGEVDLANSVATVLSRVADSRTKGRRPSSKQGRGTVSRA